MLACGVGSLHMPGAEPFYLGTWKITSAVAGPWWTEKGTPDAQEKNFLLGKIVVFKPGEITGPRQVACKGPNYKVVTVPAEGLYQGAFDEMKQHDKTVDPLKLANRLGFRNNEIKTVQTGCATELDWHFVDDTTTTFGLNNYVYFLKKQ